MGEWATSITTVHFIQITQMLEKIRIFWVVKGVTFEVHIKKKKNPHSSISMHAWPMTARWLAQQFSMGDGFVSLSVGYLIICLKMSINVSERTVLLHAVHC